MILLNYFRALLYKKIYPLYWRKVVYPRRINTSELKVIQITEKCIQGINKLRSTSETKILKTFFTKKNKEQSISEAELLLEGKYNFFSNEYKFWGNPPNWHQDVITGFHFPKKPYHTYIFGPREDGSDIKHPWEIARFAWVIWLGQAFYYTNNSKYEDHFQQTLMNFIQNNPLGYGIHWHTPMEISIRSINILYSFIAFFDITNLSETNKRILCLYLFSSIEFISFHLEYAVIPGNHLIAGTIGLLLGGIIFDNSAWKKKAITILEREINKQFSHDGVNYEGSSAYHRHSGEMFLFSVYIAGINQFSEDYHNQLLKIVQFSELLMRPSQSVPAFGDEDSGRIFRLSAKENFRSHEEFIELYYSLHPTSSSNVYQSSSLELECISKSGYHIIYNSVLHCCIDGADIGLAGHGGHGHNDGLSAIVEVHGIEILTDPGTYCYTSFPNLRNTFRSTKSHNTIYIPGIEQALFTTLFRAKQPPNVYSKLLENSHNIVSIELQSIGYQGLAVDIIRRMTIRIDNQNSGIIEFVDTVKIPQNSQTWFQQFIVPYSNSVKQLSDKVIIILYKNIQVKYVFEVTVAMEEVPISPMYGVMEKGLRLYAEKCAKCVITWERIADEAG